MLTEKEEKVIVELHIDFKLKEIERSMKQFITESVEALLLRLKYQSVQAQPLSTIKDIASRFKVSKATIHNWIQRGIIKGVKVGKNRYFTEEEIGGIVRFLKRP